jgi:hypothetical protein
MKMIAEGVVTGFTKFKGNIDGQDIDANTVFIEVDIGSMGKGTRTVARKCVDEGVIKKIEHLPFPIQAQIVIEEQATAKKEQLVVLEIRPVQRAPAAKAA